MADLRTRISLIAKKEVSFSEIELEILHMLAFEYNVREIEMEVNLSNSEIQQILFKMYRKMGVNTRIGLIRVAFEKRLLILS